jgi:hypothetical protein
VSLSEDEGRTWPWTRHLERDPPSPEASAGQAAVAPGGRGQYHYPSIIQARDGSLHATYSYFVAGGKAIKHAHFDEAWIKTR